MGHFQESIQSLNCALSACEDERLAATILLSFGITYEKLGAYSEAVTAYGDAQEIWYRHENVTGLAFIENNAGVVYHKQGNYVQAISSFEKSIKHSQQSGQKTAQGLALASIGDVCSEIGAVLAADQAYKKAETVAKNINSTFILDYLAKIDIQPVSVPLKTFREIRKVITSVEFDPPALILTAFGVSKTVVNNKRVTWQRTAARDLLFFLMEQSRPVSRDYILDNLWPTLKNPRASFDRARTALHNTIGQAAIVFDSDLKLYSLDRCHLDYSYDVEAFLDGDLDVYTAPYLLDIEADWVIPRREYLAQRYRKAVLDQGEFALEKSDYDTALSYVYRGLQVDICDEPIHRLTMRIYAAMGDLPNPD